MKRILPLALFLLALPRIAGGQGAPAPDVELARDLVERGEILPLAQVLQKLQRAHPGQVVEVELEYSDGALVYEIELITPQGRMIEVDMAAATGNIVNVDEEDED